MDGPQKTEDFVVPIYYVMLHMHVSMSMYQGGVRKNTDKDRDVESGRAGVRTPPLPNLGPQVTNPLPPPQFSDLATSMKGKE